jgi:hypothetical protein
MSPRAERRLAVAARHGQIEQVGFFDRARALLGLDKAEGKARESDPANQKVAAATETGRRARKEKRPPLPEAPPAPGISLEDVLSVRDTGDFEKARELLRQMDRGHGLRAVLRAAAALEARDEAELSGLLPALAAQEPSWALTLQLAAAVSLDDERRPLWVREAEQLGAPNWALAWLAATSADPDVQRQGLVDLLFDDPRLARTVAARDLAIPKVVADNEAIARYASFAHGRDIVRRFGAGAVADLLERLRGAPK